MRRRQMKWTTNRVAMFLVDMGVDENEINELPGGDIFVKPAAEPYITYPGVYYDATKNMLTLEYPDYDYELDGDDIRKIGKIRPKQYMFCGVPVTVRASWYETTNEVGEEILVPTTVFEIDLDKVPSEEKLRCVIEKILEPGDWWDIWKQV